MRSAGLPPSRSPLAAAPSPPALVTGAAGRRRRPRRTRSSTSTAASPSTRTPATRPTSSRSTRTPTERTPRIVGVGVMNGDVRLGRPIDWYVRAADYTPQHRLISYQSPRQFLFSIFERIDSPEDTWTDVERRYEADVAAEGSHHPRRPHAGGHRQHAGPRLHPQDAASRPAPEYQNYAHEVLIRGDHRLMLVQIIHGENVEAIEDEIDRRASRASRSTDGWAARQRRRAQPSRGSGGGSPRSSSSSSSPGRRRALSSRGTEMLNCWPTWPPSHAVRLSVAARGEPSWKRGAVVGLHVQLEHHVVLAAGERRDDGAEHAAVCARRAGTRGSRRSRERAEHDR